MAEFIAHHVGSGLYEPVCPNCGSDYLHHETVTVFNRRREDDIMAQRTTVAPDGSIRSEMADSYGSGNPSSRRDGLTIRFSCEGCEYVSTLGIAQHKGNTQISWVSIVPDDTEDSWQPFSGAYFSIDIAEVMNRRKIVRLFA